MLLCHAGVNLACLTPLLQVWSLSPYTPKSRDFPRMLLKPVEHHCLKGKADGECDSVGTVLD